MKAAYPPISFSRPPAKCQFAMPGIFAVLLMEPLRPGYPLSRMENEMENLLCNIKFDCVPGDRVDGQMGKGSCDCSTAPVCFCEPVPLCPVSWLAGLSKLSQHCGAVSVIVAANYGGLNA